MKPYQKPTNYLLNYKGKAKISKILSFEEISYQEIVDISKNPLENYIILPRMADKKHDYYQKILINQKFIGMIQGSRHDEFVFRGRIWQYDNPWAIYIESIERWIDSWQHTHPTLAKTHDFLEENVENLIECYRDLL